jgi:hypothetical protein
MVPATNPNHTNTLQRGKSVILKIIFIRLKYLIKLLENFWRRIQSTSMQPRILAVPKWIYEDLLSRNLRNVKLMIQTA